MASGAPPELRLLLALLQGRAEPLPPGADATRLLALVDFHRVDLRLGPHVLERLPDAVQVALATRRQTVAAKAMMLAVELSRLARTFESRGLPWLAFKGPAVGLLLYGRLGCRASRDLDLLVPAEAEGAAIALLAEAGYTGAPRVPGIRQAELKHVRTGRLVELHVGMIDQDALFPSRLFQPFRRIIRLDIGGAPVPTLALDAALVFAAFHGCKHFWRRLFWVADFADAARSDRVDWEATLDLARTVGSERQLAVALALAERWLGAPIPAPLAARLRLCQAGRKASLPLDRLSDLPVPVLDVDAYRRLGPWTVLRWRLRLHRRTEARLALLLGIMRPSPDDQALIALPGTLSPLYYIARPLRLLLRDISRLAAAPKSASTVRPSGSGVVVARADATLQPALTIDFVVPCGRPESAAATLRSLLACGGDGEIIVVGAGLAGLRAAFSDPRFVWLETDRLLWPGVNRNRGAAHSQAEIVAFIDDDCTVAPDFVRKVRDRFHGDPNLSALVGRTRTSPPGYWARVYDLLTTATGQTEEPIVGISSFGCAFSMRRQKFLELGGCNDSLRFNEDVDLARRVRAKGLATLCDPAINIFHWHPRIDPRRVLDHMFWVGERVLVYERKRASEGAIKARIKLALRPLQPIVAPAFIALRVFLLARETSPRLWLPHLPGVLAGAVAFEAGRTVGWWRGCFRRDE